MSDNRRNGGQDDRRDEIKTSDAKAIDRLRDRTDELELIISSLTIFALFSLPGWLFNRIADIYTHLSTGLTIAGNVVMIVLAGVCYGLAACFVVHLMARAYWVGLIGLRTVFPDGIDWNRTPNLGPLTRRYYREKLPDLDTIIKNTDRLASSLFAVISMLTLSVLWFGAILVVTMVVAGAIGVRFGQTNSAMGLATGVLLFLFVVIPVLVYLLDAQLASRWPRLAGSGAFSGLVGLLRRIAGLAYPQRLVLPVQLTLQSNTRPVRFFVALILGIVVIVVLGNTRAAAWRSFTLSNEFSYLDTTVVQSGFRSTYYEDMPSSLDRLRTWPRIDSFRQSGSFVRLFLPYHPLRDNLMLQQMCPVADDARATDAEPPDTVACIRQLWSVAIDGREVPMEGFEPAERADIGMRGLIGLVPLAGLEPGMRKIEVVWNPNASEQAVPIDDRYTQASNTYVIPFAFAPDVELPLIDTAGD